MYITRISSNLNSQKYSSSFEAKAGGCAVPHPHDVWVRVGICSEGCRHLKRGLRVYLNWSGDGGSLEPFGFEVWRSHRDIQYHGAFLKSIHHEKWVTGGVTFIIMKALNFLWLWLLLLLCLTHGFEARSFHNRRYQNLRRISRSTATIHQRQMRSLTHTARCRRYIMYILSPVYFHLLPLYQGTFTPLSAGESCQKGVSLQTQRLGWGKGSKFYTYTAFHQEIYFEGKINLFWWCNDMTWLTQSYTDPAFIAKDVDVFSAYLC